MADNKEEIVLTCGNCYEDTKGTWAQCHKKCPKCNKGILHHIPEECR